MEEILRKKKNMSSARRTLLAFDRGSLMSIHRPIAGGVMTIESAHNKRLQRTRLSVAFVVTWFGIAWNRSPLKRRVRHFQVIRKIILIIVSFSLLAVSGCS